MTDGQHILTWEEAQQLALPPNTTMLVPPPQEQVEVSALAAGPPPKQPDWLDDEFRGPNAEDERATRAAAEREQYGPGPVRFITGVLTTGAVLEFARSQLQPERKPKPKLPERKSDDE